jgi:hypothetical protein
MITVRARCVGAAVLAAALGACKPTGGTGELPVPARARTAPPPASAPKPAAPAAPNYTVRATALGSLGRGQAGQFEIALAPRSGYHLNQEFPIEIKISAPTARVAKPTLGRADAKTFAETGAVFDVGVTPGAPGEEEYTARLRFAVCTDKDCRPVEDTYAWRMTAAP